MNFRGWGRKFSGKRAIFFASITRNSFTLLEDGFIKSCSRLGAPSFSIVEDEIGIYYDACSPSRLENLLNFYDFKSDIDLLEKADAAIKFIRDNNISKYNSLGKIDYKFLNKKKDRVLIISQTKGDLSLKYGLSNKFSTNSIIETAIKENPNSDIYLKIHPNAIHKEKNSDIDINFAKNKCKIIDQDINAITLLKNFSKVYTKTSQMGFEALLVGCKCVCFGTPFYACWGLTDDRVSNKRRIRKLSIREVFAASYILYSKYYNPYKKKESDIFDTLKTIVRFRKIERISNKKVYLLGFSLWKRNYLLSFLKEFKKNNIHFISEITFFKKLIKKSFKINEIIIYIWGSKKYPRIERIAANNNVKIIRVEDGFIRSIGLGSDLTRPYSLVFDDLGIYYDPSKKSRLEEIIIKSKFDEEIIREAKDLISIIKDCSISKYNYLYKSKIELPEKQKKLLVVGQVEDDASVILGTNSMTNLILLKKVKKENPDAFIIYKPHPDVIAGNRLGQIKKKDIKSYSDVVMEDVNITELISLVDEIHTMTSFVGFEGLVQRKTVVTYGTPFYSGWGLTIDNIKCKRRKRILTLEELVAAALILYPRYIDPSTENYCTPDVLVRYINDLKYKLKHNAFYKFYYFYRTYFVRKLQRLFNLFL